MIIIFKIVYEFHIINENYYEMSIFWKFEDERGNLTVRLPPTVATRRENSRRSSRERQGTNEHERQRERRALSLADLRRRVLRVHSLAYVLACLAICFSLPSNSNSACNTNGAFSTRWSENVLLGRERKRAAETRAARDGRKGRSEWRRW